MENDVQNAIQSQNNIHGKINAAPEGDDLPAFVQCSDQNQNNVSR